MSDEASRSEVEKLPSDLDLSGLGGLSLGPDWGSGSMPPSKTPAQRPHDRSGRGGHYPRNREDRGPRTGGGGGQPAQRRDRRGGRTDRREGGDFRASRQEEPFRPILVADFYPDDNAFKVLSQAIKQSCRTFELFEIARLILEKPERWVCVAKHPGQKEAEPAILHAAVPDGLPFASEADAVQHVLTHYLDQFFTVEDYEAEPPSGNFQTIHRCGITGELIGPPNFHRYQAMLRDHHANRVSNVPFEKVQARLESVRDPEVVSAWLERMKQGRRYTLKDVPEGTEAPTFVDFESARLYLLTHAKEKLVRPAYSVRFIGRDLHLLPPADPLRRSIEALHEQQMRFPLNTANNIRGRLRRLNLAVYKRGSKGVSYVCAVKRRFRTPGEVLADNIADLINFLEANPDIKASDLPRQYLGMAASSPDTTTTEQPTPEGEPETTSATSSKESADALAALRRDLRYLVTQGYVVEYSDGRLQVPPPLETPKAKEPKAKSRPASQPMATPVAEPPGQPEEKNGAEAVTSRDDEGVETSQDREPTPSLAIEDEPAVSAGPEAPPSDRDERTQPPEAANDEGEKAVVPESAIDPEPPVRERPEAVEDAGPGAAVEPVPALKESVEPALKQRSEEEPSEPSNVQPLVPQITPTKEGAEETGSKAEEAGGQSDEPGEQKPG